jgi:hypothetical protein
MVVAIDAEQLPMAAVGRIIVVIVVLVMDRQFTKLFAAELAAAPGTDPGIQLGRLPSIGLLLLRLVAPHLSHQLVLAVDR